MPAPDFVKVKPLAVILYGDAHILTVFGYGDLSVLRLGVLANIIQRFLKNTVNDNLRFGIKHCVDIGYFLGNMNAVMLFEVVQHPLE